MSSPDRISQEKLTPEERRGLLRALADRMLLKVSAMDDSEDLAGIEKTVRVTASIERIYYRCDRAEHHTPDPRKVEAERATHQRDAIKARVNLANILEWGEERRKDLGKWWDAAETTVQTQIPAPVSTPVLTRAAAPKEAPFVYRYDDDGVEDTVAPASSGSEIGPVLDTLLDDLEELTDAMEAGTAYGPLRAYPPAKSPPYACADDATYAQTKAIYDNLRQVYELKSAGASP